MDLSNLSPGRGARRDRKRLGRGPASGQGKTAGRGQKGAGARSGGSVPPGYEGGQMPLQRRLPKRGFHNPFRRAYTVVNLKRLEERFAAGDVVDPEQMRKLGLARKGMPIKVLGEGELSKGMTVRAHAFSKSARSRIEAVGGSVEVVEGA